MAFTVVYDACTLYPAPLRDLLMRLAHERPDLTPTALLRTRALMCAAVADCLVSGYEDIERSIELPDADDRHVVAAAIRCSAQTIVTYNLRDFPDRTLAPFGIEAKHPDDFILDLIGISVGTVVSAVTEQADALRNPPVTIDALLRVLRARGLEQSVARLSVELGMSI